MQTIAFSYADKVNSFTGSKGSWGFSPLSGADIGSWHALLEPGLIFLLKCVTIRAGFGLR